MRNGSLLTRRPRPPARVAAGRPMLLALILIGGGLVGCRRAAPGEGGVHAPPEQTQAAKAPAATGPAAKAPGTNFAAMPGGKGGLSPGASAMGAGPAGGDRLHTAVSILPHAYFVERIGGERVSAEVLVGPGQSPHTYEPSPGQLAGLARARVLFRTGLGFEETLIPKIQAAFPEIEIVDLQAGLPLRRAEEHEAHAHAEGEEHAAHDQAAGEEHEAHHPVEGEEHAAAHAHEHEGADPHTWLDPQLAKRQAGTIAAALQRLDPEGAELYGRNLAALLGELDELHAHIAAALAPLKGREFFVYHPAFGYFADRYGLRQVAVEVGGKEPTARELAELIRRARAGGVRVIFVQPQFPARGAEAVAAAIGGAVVPLDDLPRDYLASLHAMANAIEEALRREGGAP